jgi:hypothetical protein
MAPYPQMYADQRHSSRQQLSPKFTGKKTWFLPSDDPSRNAPWLLLMADDRLIVEYHDRFQAVSLDGKSLWTHERNAGMHVFLDNGLVYFRSQAGRLSSVDLNNQPKMTGYDIATSTPDGFFHCILPVDQTTYLVQTGNRAPERVPGEPYSEDDYNLLLMTVKKPAWIHRFNGTALPSLITGDRKKIVLPNQSGRVRSFTIADGIRTDSLLLQGCLTIAVSLDNSDRLVIAYLDKQRQTLLRCASLNGATAWEINIPPLGEHIGIQPPAIDINNRVYFIANTTLMAIEQGKVTWEIPVFRADYEYVACLGDTTILVATGVALRHIDNTGKQLATFILPPGEEITTPPVLDKLGRVYVGTSQGIYCIE